VIDTDGPLSDLERARDAILDRSVRCLEADARAGAAWLLGSFGRGEADAWSDLDLLIAVADEHLETFLAERPALYTRIGRPLIVQDEMPSDVLDGARFQLVVFDGPVEVDWNIGPLSRARRADDSVLLFDRAGVPPLVLPPLSPEERRARARERLIFFWAMAPIAVKYAGRGETRRVGRQIELLTQPLIALRRLVNEPEGPEPWRPQVTNRRLEPELDALLPMLGETIDPLSALAVIRALCDEVERLHPALAALGVPIPSEMPGAVRAMAATAEAVVLRGGLPRRRFR
jgi:predicted nucleotidyltransferase